MLTPVEDLGFSHDVEIVDGEWDGLEKVHAKFTAQWYVDPNGLAWNFEKPGYVLREQEVFLDGACSVITERDGDEWLIRLYGPGYNFKGEATYSSAQWVLGDDFQFDGEEDLSSFTLSNDLLKLEMKPIPSFSKVPSVYPLIIKDSSESNRNN